MKEPSRREGLGSNAQSVSREETAGHACPDTISGNTIQHRPQAVSELLACALQYAGRGWKVLPLHSITEKECTCSKGSACKSPGKHPRIKTGRNHENASADPAQINRWWAKWPMANVGIVTGAASGLAVVDVDSAAGAELLASLQPGPMTLAAVSGRAGGGLHLYYSATAAPSNSGGGLDIRGDGGLVVAPPSRHASGSVYRWLDAGAAILPMPAHLLAWFRTREGSPRAATRRQEAPTGLLGPKPAHLKGRGDRLNQRVGIEEPAPIEDVASALQVIDNPDLGWDAWSRIGMAVYRATEGSDDGHAAFDEWSAKSQKYNPDDVDERWEHWARSPPTEIGYGALWFEAKAADPTWEPPSHRRVLASAQQLGQPENETLNDEQIPLPEALTQVTSGNPLILLNERYAAIGDIGGKCLVMSWISSKVDPLVKVPSFQSFKSFSERYANQYIMVRKENKRTGEISEEPAQIGTYWLKWTGRRSYEGIDLIPGGPGVLPGNYLNLWTGFAVQPSAGSWSRMQEHIYSVLADNDRASAEYIFRFAAWAVQHPGERAETALVFRGGKGSGKGSFANALKQLFGQHGLQVFNSKHLVGAFNGHLRNCLLLFADEAFWAGDKQGESVLKGMLTEPALMIEQKGIDAAPWKNRLHVIMSANAEWVVPASHDERRYAMFDVSPARIGDEQYFNRLHDELMHGGLGAMLHDLQAMDLKGWHPRRLVYTEALRTQKGLSLKPLEQFWENILQEGRIMFMKDSDKVMAAWLLDLAKAYNRRHSDEVNPTSLGLFLKKVGCYKVHTAQGNAWRFPGLTEARKAWETRYAGWNWEQPIEGWNAPALAC